MAREDGSISDPDAAGWYEVRISLGVLGGKRQRVRRRVRTFAEARATLEEMRAPMGTRAEAPVRHQPLTRTSPDGLYARARDIEPKTLRNYRYGVALIAECLKEVRHALKESRAIGSPKSRASRRRIDLAASTVDELRAHAHRTRRLRVTTDLVFASTIGTTLLASKIERRHFFPALKRAGLRRIRFHDLRHTCAALRLLAGEHPMVIQALLGHASAKTTMDVYEHLASTIARAAASRYDDMIRN